MKEFAYMPRITILPGLYEEERIRTLKEYCLKYRYDEVMFFINAENLNDGHIELTALKPYLEVIKRAKESLAGEGIKTSLNPWNSLLGCERGGVLKQGQNFELMADIDGRTGKVTPCPLGKAWREYFVKYYLLLIEEVHPNIIWIEDDFRMHNHFPLHWGGCFCEEHMRLYADAVGRDITREELVAGMADGRENGLFRKAYYSVTRKVMNELAAFIGSRIHEVYSDQKIGLMTSDPKMHSIEGRDWFGILKNLGGSTAPIDRIHLPSYRQCCAQDYCWGFNDISMQTRALVPEETVVLPEVENAMFSPFTKSRNFTRFQVESSLSLCPDGITLDLDCFAGNGLIPEYGYGRDLAQIKDYMSAFLSLGIPFSSMDGICVPVREDAFLFAESCGSLPDIRINENWWASQFASLGIAYRYDKSEAFFNKIVAVSGNYFDGLSDEQIKNLFKNNFVLLEGKSVEILFKRGLNGLIGANSCREMDAEKGEYSFEEACDGKVYLGINRARASATVTCPKYVNIEYRAAELFTNMLNNKECVVGAGEAVVNNAFVLPFLCEGKHHGLLTTMREQILKDALRSVAGYSTPVIYTSLPYVSLYFYKMAEYDVLFAVNYSDDVHEHIPVYGLGGYRRVEVLGRNGDWAVQSVCKDGSDMVFGHRLEATSTAIFKLYKRG